MVLNPKSRRSSPESTSYSDSGYAPSGSPPRQREPSPPPLLPALQTVLKHPRILECFLPLISYGDFSSLTSSCSDLRNLMQEPTLKDKILSWFLPGFRSLLRSKAPELFVDVRVTVSDLNVFHLSNRIGLHVYPIHALQFSTRFDEAYQLKLLRKLQCFTIVHSKFVLLLQSLAHSSLQPFEPELEDSSPHRSSTLQTPSLGIKHLYFPEPLCYGASPAIHRTPSYHRHKRSRSVEIVTGESGIPVKKWSLLGRSRQPPPAPSSDFIIRQSYFSPWRRILHSSSLFGMIEPTSPQRRRFLGTSSPSDSSLSTSARLSMIQETRASTSLSRPRVPLQSPHDIHLATSRSHAPILRVFVPCSELNDISIAACEDQLADAGLWVHLSIGDIVCNLGYMPSLPLPEDLRRDSVGATSASVKSQPSSLGSRTIDDAVWLIFDGFGLVPYSPVLEPPPLKDALTFVTPYYYSHILPSSAHPFFTLDLYSRLSRFRGSTNGTRGNTFSPPVPPKFELIAMVTKVRSPKSPGGYAMVKCYKWVATIKGIKAALSGDLETGSGWLTDEWVLEVDGTLEGRRMLDSLLSSPGPHIASDWARGNWVWEVDRQRSNLNKTWFRLLGDSEDYVLPPDPAALSSTGPASTAQFHRGSPRPFGKELRQFSFMAR